MDHELERGRVAKARVARLATVRADGRPHIVPCCFVLDRLIYTAVDDVKPKATLRLRRLDNIADNPRVSLLVDHYSDDWSSLWWIRLDGRAHVASDKERVIALDLLAAKYEQYMRHPPPGPVVVIEIDTWRSWP